MLTLFLFRCQSLCGGIEFSLKTDFVVSLCSLLVVELSVGGGPSDCLKAWSTGYENRTIAY